MARKSRRGRSGKRTPKRVSDRSSGRGSARMSGRKPKSSAKKGRGAPSAAAAKGEMARALAALEWSHAFTDRLIEGVPADKLTWQSGPNDNHMLWSLGHLASTYLWCASLLDGKKVEIPPEMDKPFAFGAKPVGDAGQYPGVSAVRAHYERSYTRLLEAIRALSDADGLAPTAADAGWFAKTKLDVVWRAVWHEGWHQGQISTLRRAMGLPGVM